MQERSLSACVLHEGSPSYPPFALSPTRDPSVFASYVRAPQRVPVAKLEADINAQRSPEATRFDAGEIKAALKYLEEVESKVMLDGGMIYRI